MPFNIHLTSWQIFTVIIIRLDRLGKYGLLYNTVGKYLVSVFLEGNIVINTKKTGCAMLPHSSFLVSI